MTINQCVKLNKSIISIIRDIKKQIEGGKNLLEQEIREELIGSEVMATARAIVLVTEVSGDAHVAKAVTTYCEEGIFYNLHANRAEEILL